MIQAYNYIIHIGPFLQVKFCLSNFHLFVCFISICWLLAVCIVWIIYIIIISQWSWMCMGNPGIFFLSHHICISIFIERNTSSVQLVVRQILVNLVYVCHSMTGRGEYDIINRPYHSLQFNSIKRYQSCHWCIFKWSILCFMIIRVETIFGFFNIQIVYTSNIKKKTVNNVAKLHFFQNFSIYLIWFSGTKSFYQSVIK